VEEEEVDVGADEAGEEASRVGGGGGRRGTGSWRLGLEELGERTTMGIGERLTGVGIGSAWWTLGIGYFGPI
jgi:hypothetical protein